MIREPAPRDLVDPELLPLLDLMPGIDIGAATLAEARARGLPLPPNPANDVTVERIMVPGRDGGPDVPVIVYRPPAAAPLPCILHIHGGGYVMGAAAMLEPLHRAMADDLNCAIVAVDYRLAPETAFPGAIEDCYAALAWASAAPWIDAARIGVMGESAGGGLAAALALLARDRGDYRLAFQHLIYPMLDDRTGSTVAPPAYTGDFVWTPASNAFGWASLLGHAPGGEGVSPYAAAARAGRLLDLPPAYIAVGALDLFSAENMDYARRLMAAGVPVELHIYPGAFHGFDLAPDAAVAKQARRDSREALKRRF